MRYYAIGKIAEDGALIGYRIYDDVEKISTMVLIKDIKKVLSAGYKIAGLRYHVGKGGTVIATLAGKNFRADDLQYCDEDYVRVYILVETLGVGDNRRYRVVDFKGNEKIFSLSEISSLIDEDRIIGANKGKGGLIKIYKNCKRNLDK